MTTRQTDSELENSVIALGIACATALLSLIAFIACNTAIAGETVVSTYGNLVDDTGNVCVAKDFRSDWTLLGTWSIAD